MESVSMMQALANFPVRFPCCRNHVREERGYISVTHRSFVVAFPNKFIVFPSGVAPHAAEFNPFFSILDCVRVVTMQLPEAFKNNLFSFSLDPVAIIPEPCLELYK